MSQRYRVMIFRHECDVAPGLGEDGYYDNERPTRTFDDVDHLTAWLDTLHDRDNEALRADDMDDN